MFVCCTGSGGNSDADEHTVPDSTLVVTTMDERVQTVQPKEVGVGTTAVLNQQSSVAEAPRQLAAIAPTAEAPRQIAAVSPTAKASRQRASIAPVAVLADNDRSTQGAQLAMQKVGSQSSTAARSSQYGPAARSSQYGVNTFMDSVSLSVLQATATHRRSMVQRALKSGKFDTNERDKVTGLTPLQLAQEANLEDIAIELANAGADVNVKDNHGNTPLHVAAWNGEAEIAKHLLARKCDILASNHLGNQPLHNAVQMSREDVVELLVNARADLHAVNDVGYTPGGLAEDMGTVAMSNRMSILGAGRFSQS